MIHKDYSKFFEPIFIISFEPGLQGHRYIDSV